MTTRHNTRDEYMQAFEELVGQPLPADFVDTLNVLSFYKLDVVLALVNLAKNTNGHAETAEDTAVDTVARVLDVMTSYAGSKNAKVRELLPEPA